MEKYIHSTLVHSIPMGAMFHTCRHKNLFHKWNHKTGDTKDLICMINGPLCWLMILAAPHLRMWRRCGEESHTQLCHDLVWQHKVEKGHSRRDVEVSRDKLSAKSLEVTCAIAAKVIVPIVQPWTMYLACVFCNTTWLDWTRRDPDYYIPPWSQDIIITALSLTMRTVTWILIMRLVACRYAFILL